MKLFNSLAAIAITPLVITGAPASANDMSAMEALPVSHWENAWLNNPALHSVLCPTGRNLNSVNKSYFSDFNRTYLIGKGTQAGQSYLLANRITDGMWAAVRKACPEIW
ncbi:hypothetical protein [Synechococcus sp. BIOS-E4-1]|uniref:hypothetical protein n=1 Tax=Synechococcus sp. BIOS-E4-1 TaxID=1400864 RepID=UPI001644C385|nr:hypothetical protein [Synechococcus sp. BIOS-E4-1]